MSKTDKDQTAATTALSVIEKNDKLMSQSPWIKQPGDRIEQRMTPHGDVVTKVRTEEGRITARQYVKEGRLGKTVLTVMENEK